jgi:hypothetical protein
MASTSSDILLRSRRLFVTDDLAFCLLYLVSTFVGVVLSFTLGPCLGFFLGFFFALSLSLLNLGFAFYMGLMAWLLSYSLSWTWTIAVFRKRQREMTVITFSTVPRPIN